MKYTIIDNFLEDDFCNELINDAEKYTSINQYTNIHGNRKSLENSSLEFNELIKKSNTWKKLEEKINNQDFLDFCSQKLSIENSFILKNFFKIKTISKTYEIYKKVSKKKLNSIPSKSLLKYFFLRILRDFNRKLKFSKLFFPKKIPTELLYDYSKAGNGYSREIHRDSDSRVIVILIYLNSLSSGNDNAKSIEGGTLDLFKLVKKDENLARPKKESCELIKSITPKKGKMFIFLNENDSYHAVSELKNLDGYRNFIYGGFTILSQKNPFISNKSNLKTEFHFYE